MMRRWTIRLVPFLLLAAVAFAFAGCPGKSMQSGLHAPNAVQGLNHY